MFFTFLSEPRISHNALLKLGSEVVGRATTFGLTLYAAQQLGESTFGLYNYGLALGFVLAQLADLGLQLWLSREVAVQDRAARELVWRGLRLKLILSLPVMVLLALVTHGWSLAERLSLFVLGLIPLANTYLEFVAYVFRGQQRLLVEARLLALTRLTVAAAGFLVLWRGGGLPGLALSGLVGVALFALLALHLLRQAGWLVAPVNPRDLAADRRLLRQALPLGIAIFLSIAYTRLAIFLLQAASGPVAVAHFSAAYRLVEPTQIIPASLLAAVFPAYAHALHNDPGAAQRLAARVGGVLLLAGLAVAAGFALGAPWLVVLLYGTDYGAAVPVLQVLGLSTALTFVNYGLTHFLVARERQRLVTLFTAVMLALHTVVSWLLIPRLGAVGTAVSIILAETVLLVACLTALRQPVRVPIEHFHADRPSG